MKMTEHFQQRVEQRGIKAEWCLRVVEAPLELEREEHGYFRYWGYIEERGKVLRVVLLEDQKTFHTAFWDSGYKGRS
jgi:hypothetical protein